MLVLLQSITFTQQEQVNLNKEKSLKQRGLRPCGSASLGLFPYVWPWDPKASQASQAEPLHVPIYAAMSHMCVSVQSPVFQLASPGTVLWWKASIHQPMSVSWGETQTTGILMLAPTVIETQYMALSILAWVFCCGFFFFSFCSWLTGSKKTNIFIIYYYGALQYNRATILSWKCIASTLAVSI